MLNNNRFDDESLDHDYDGLSKETPEIQDSSHFNSTISNSPSAINDYFNNGNYGSRQKQADPVKDGLINLPIILQEE